VLYTESTEIDYPEWNILWFCHSVCQTLLEYEPLIGYNRLYASIHVWRYSPFWALAFLKRRLHLLQLRIPRICRASPCTTSPHPLLGFPTDLVFNGLHEQRNIYLPRSSYLTPLSDHNIYFSSRRYINQYKKQNALL
jgi:hypothetical protein